VIGTPELAAMRLSLSVALVLVGLPLWALHWSVVQRTARRPEEQHARLRRVYGYLVLLVAVLTVLFALRDLFAVLFGAVVAKAAGQQAATAIAGIVVQGSIWLCLVWAGVNHLAAPWHLPWWHCRSTPSLPRPWSGARMRHLRKSARWRGGSIYMRRCSSASPQQ
jgi:hypothetical protein